MFNLFGETNPQNSMAKGRAALTYFHNQAVTYPEYNLTFPLLVQTLGKTESLQSGRLEGLGDAIVMLELSDSEVKAAMESLADRGQGKIPEVATDYSTALIDKSHDFSFIRAGSHVVDAVKDSVVAASTDLASVGEGVVNSVKGLSVILPFLVVGAAIFIVVAKSKRLAS